MAAQRTILYIAFGLLAFSLLLCSVNSTYSPSADPTERIASATNFADLAPEFSFIKYSVGAVLVQITVPNNAVVYGVVCTATLISSDTMISNANCVRNALQLAADCDPFIENRQLVVAIGMDSISNADMSKANVLTNTITPDKLIFHPKSTLGYNTNDLVLIKLTKKASNTKFNPLFVPSSLNTTINSELGYYMVSWGQPACTGIVNNVENIVLAPSDPDTSNKISNKGVDQIVHELINLRTGLPAYTTFGDIGSPVFLPQNEGDFKIQFVIRSIGGVNTKKALPDGRIPSAYGTSCSKESFMAATDLLDPDNIKFLSGNIPADQMRPIYEEPQ